MRTSELFTRTRRDAPKDEVSKNAQLLIRGGFVHKEMAGVYSWLPLGLRVLEKVNAIIREELAKIGAQELFLSSLQDRAPWEKTGRWDDKAVDVWFKTKLKNGTDLGLGFTHEEPLTALMRNHITSYKDLPVSVFQIQTKFRNETRAKSGVMRGREFLMKDLYSFSKDAESHAAFYEKAKQAYKAIFERLGLGERTYLTYASGGSFSQYSHEFQTLTEAGEDVIHICEACKVAVNDEIFGEQKKCPQCGAVELKQGKAVEVGNIFNLGTKFSEALELLFKDEAGKLMPVVMGSYGIGPGRAIGTAVETLADEKGIVWPASIAPFKVHLVAIGLEKAPVKEAADKLYAELSAAGIETLYDDRDTKPGDKLSDADLLGMPWRIVVSEKTLAAGGFELKARTLPEGKIVSAADMLSVLSEKTA
jgi:prolyl-tRNA synthetase